jgi:lysozyme
LSFLYITVSNGVGYPSLKPEKFEKFRRNLLVNWNEARKRGFLVGAIHTFDLCDKADGQFNHFQKSVTSLKHDLVPVIRIEANRYCPGFYDRDVNKISEQMRLLLKKVEQAYGKKPVVMGSVQAYEKFYKGRLSAYPLWVQSVFSAPDLGKEGQWQFWQFSKRGLVDGLKSSRAKLSVFRGGKSELERFKMP